MKTLEVYPSMSLSHLQQRFNDLFPYLRLELSLETDEIVNNQKTLDELGHSTTYCCFLIDDTLEVAELEENFSACFGLILRVSRWTGYGWHDTETTRHWTLHQQNQKGAEAAHLTPSVAYR